MKLRKPIIASSFKTSINNKQKSDNLPWDQYDNLMNSYDFGESRKFEESGAISRPSGKGRFGKRALSFTIDYGGHSNDSSSNDSGVGGDFHSSESQSQSQLSWCSEDSHLGRSSSISNIAGASASEFSGSSLNPPFSASRKKQFLKKLLLESLAGEAAIGSNDDEAMTGFEKVNVQQDSKDLSQGYFNVAESQKTGAYRFTSLPASSSSSYYNAMADVNLVQKLLRESETPVNLVDDKESSASEEGRLINPVGFGDKAKEELNGRSIGPCEDNENQEHQMCASSSISHTQFPPSSKVNYGMDDNFVDEDKAGLSETEPKDGIGDCEADVDPLVILSQAVSLQKELCEDSIKDKPILNLGLDSKVGISSLFDINSAKLLMPEKAQLAITEKIRKRTFSDNTDTSAMRLCNEGSGYRMINAAEPTTARNTPPPPKRQRFGCLPPRDDRFTLRNRNQNIRSIGHRQMPLGTAPTLADASLSHVSRDGRVQLRIEHQPEEQHRARYQTEGSRGAIKDTAGNGFPKVRLLGYDRPATLQIFIGTDQGNVSPHMFYQACKVTGKSSTTCMERKIEGTMVIEIDFPNDKTITCDCVGILKERNVDVEQRLRFSTAAANQSRKKSTKCRMVFRTTIINSAGMEETLQVSSSPILCTQPAGLPELCRQSHKECSAPGGIELFIIGKNFLKDTKVVFFEGDGELHSWEVAVEPAKDYLQQNHLIVTVPPYAQQNILSPVPCNFVIASGDKRSEPYRFTYLPITPTVHYGNPATALTQKSSPSHGGHQDSVNQCLPHGQPLMNFDYQTMGSRGDSSIGTTVNSLSDNSLSVSRERLSPVASNMCQMVVGASGLHQQLAVSSPPLDPLPPSPFNNNIIPPNAAQEQLVVHQLQSILESTQQQENAMSDMRNPSNNLSIKPETTYVNANCIPTTSANMPSSVPPGLEFLNEPIQPMRTRPPMTFGNQNMRNSNSQFSPVNNLDCMNQQQVPQMLNRSGSLELSPDQKMQSDLMQNSQVPSPLNNPFGAVGTSACTNAITMNSVHPNNMGIVVTATGLMLQNGCIEQSMVKSESQIRMHSGIMNNVAVSNQTNAAGSNINDVAGTYMESSIGSDMQPHHRTMANEMMKLPDKELIEQVFGETGEFPFFAR